MESTPHRPFVPCTEMAPTGSSTCITRSTNSTEMHTRTPAISPMITDPTGFTNPEGAVMATSPASKPLPVIDASGLLYRSHMYSIAPNDPAIPASIVFTAIDPMRRPPLLEAPSVEPGLNPNQPKASMKQPVNTITMSCARMAFDFPERSYLPMRGPIIIETASAVIPPTACTTPDPAKSHGTGLRGKCRPRLASRPTRQAEVAKGV